MKQVTTIVMATFGTILLSSIGNDLKSLEPTSIQTEPIEEVAEVVVWDSFVAAVIQVESRGNDNAYCRKEDAVGCLQIRPIMVREVNRILKLNNIRMRYTLNDRWSRVRSLEMFEIMAEEVECCDGLTRLEFYEIVARKWNGGHRGHKKRSTKKYWKKVKEKL
jgi:hypothetical protein